MDLWHLLFWLTPACDCPELWQLCWDHEEGQDTLRMIEQKDRSSLLLDDSAEPLNEPALEPPRAGFLVT